jgi:hypothetical protein
VYREATIQGGEDEAGVVTPAAARAEFDAEVTYLDTATMGLPPRRSWLALQEALAGWRAGTADAVGYDRPLAEARRAYAQLVGVPPAHAGDFRAQHLGDLDRHRPDPARGAVDQDARAGAHLCHVPHGDQRGEPGHHRRRGVGER